MEFRILVELAAPELLILEEISPEVWTELAEEYQREQIANKRCHLSLVRDEKQCIS